MDKIFHWNKFSWRYPLSKIISPDEKIDQILELGASGKSSVALYFNSYSDLTLTCYPSDELDPLNKLIADRRSVGKLSTASMSIHEVVGCYDLIVMKSVLGGVCRSNSVIDCHSKIIDKLLKNHLKDNGMLITLDNGYSFFEFFLYKFGARKNSWRFFHPSEFTGFSQQECFGFFTAFSFRTRLGFIGILIENFLFLLDFLLIPLHRNKYPTVIVTKYSKDLK